MSREEDAYVIERMGKLLAEIAIIVNGAEPHDTLWSYHDLPEKVRALKQAQQPAAAVPDGMALVQKWREQANAALRRSGTWNGNDMADRIDDMADELEAMLAAAERKGVES